MRWSGSNRGGAEEIAMQKLHSERRSCELQLPHRNDNPLSPGYTEPLCVSEHPSSYYGVCTAAEYYYKSDSTVK